MSSDKGPKDFNEYFKREAKKGRKIKLSIEAEEMQELVCGRGHPKMSFKSPIALICRKSNFVCEKTIMVSANKAAIDFDRKFIKKLQNPYINVKITLEIL